MTVSANPINDQSRVAMRAGGAAPSPLGSASYTPAQTRIIEAALVLFAEHALQTGRRAQSRLAQ